MRTEELKKIIIETNNTSTQPVDNELLEEILAIVIRHPLEEERGVGQEEIRKLIIRNVRE